MRTQEIPLYARYVMKHYGFVFSRARRELGSWTVALIAVGIVTKDVATKLNSSRRSVLKALRAFLENSSKDTIPRILGLQAEVYFGSLRKAKIAVAKGQKVCGNQARFRKN